jgi:hypothetical protein
MTVNGQTYTQAVAVKPDPRGATASQGVAAAGNDDDDDQ